MNGNNDDHARNRRLAEPNMKNGIHVLLSNYVAQEAILQVQLMVHGLFHGAVLGRLDICYMIGILEVYKAEQGLEIRFG
ncbi:hypothetical protein BGZ60DRAFT_406504 [Tricladium varicosporioides]|nr:hypothetical protein BGZ60DRAFT_406504 [Hymenoscyphus varicosporioides]